MRYPTIKPYGRLANVIHENKTNQEKENMRTLKNPREQKFIPCAGGQMQILLGFNKYVKVKPEGVKEPLLFSYPIRSYKCM